MTGGRTQRHRLGNGLRVVLAPDSRVPVVGVCLAYLVGSRHEAEARSGFAHLFEHMMFEGSAHVGRNEHFRLVQSAGGRTNAYTGYDTTVYSETLPSHELELALWLEADRMASLGDVLSQETLDSQRDVVKNERRKRVDNPPYGTWEERLFALAYPSGHPYHHSAWGSMEDLGAASLDDVRAFFVAHYAPNNAVLTIVGDLDPEPTLEMVERHFAAIPQRPVPAAPSGAGLLRRSAVDSRTVSGIVPLPRIYLGVRIAPFQDDAFVIGDFVTDLLATGRAARLQRRLVREQRLAHEAEAWTFPLADGAGLLVITATAREGVAVAALEDGLEGELRRLADEPIGQEEVERVRIRRLANRAATMQQAEERADRMAMYAALLDDPERVYAEAERDAAVTPVAIGEWARAALAPVNVARLRYVPEPG